MRYVSLFLAFMVWTSVASAAPESFADLAEKMAPTVVNISTSSEAKVIEQPNGMPHGSPFEGTPFEDMFRDFFQGMPQMQRGPMQSLGSGVVISDDGYIVTNNHVVKNADNIVVRFSEDRKEYEAELVGTDRKNDLALIKIDVDHKLPYAKFGDSDAIRVGDWVVAVGNPFGLGGTVTAGIISARGRNINQGPYDDFLQTDAAINPGNSGGPLFNVDGDIVGINTAILSRSGGSQGIGFSVPANTVSYIVEQIKEHGHPIRGWLGVRIQTVTPELAEALGLKADSGALVAAVSEDSPAAQAKIQDGDVIIRFDGKNIDQMSELPKLVAETDVGKTVDVDVMRDGKIKTLKVKIAQLEEGGEEEDEMSRGSKKSDAIEGMTLKKLTKSSRDQLGVDDAVDGVLVVHVESRSLAAKSGIRPRDIIKQINGKKVDAPSDVEKALKKADKSALVLLHRDGANLFIAIKKEDKE